MNIPENQSDTRPDYVKASYEAIKPQLQAQGKKFILIIFDAEEFLKAKNFSNCGYGIELTASCGAPVIQEVLRNLLSAETSRQ